MRTFLHRVHEAAVLLVLLMAGTCGAKAAESVIEGHTGTGGEEITTEYKLYGSDFEQSYQFHNETELYDGFHAAWAWSPSYIKAQDGYCEFYYNQAACDEDNRRMRRGCEIACDFSTQSQGWYGYKLFLPEGKMPKDLTNTIITQFFQGGSRNSWAGHLDIDGENLQLQYRHALVDPVVKTVGKLEWNKWQNIVVYFRVGKNNKGCIKVWLGDNGAIDKENPALVCEGINFGFANKWADDTHQDPTPYEVDGKEYTDALGGKWGFYVSQGGDRTMCMAHLRVLSGNPENAFELVNPATAPDPSYGANLTSLIQNSECTSLDGWTDSAGVWAVDNTNNMGGDKQKYFQIWTGSTAPAGTLSQSITLDKGNYRLSVDGIAVSDGNNKAISDGTVVLFATANGVTEEVPFCGTKKKPQNVSLEFEVAENQTAATIGIQVKHNSAANWVAVDNFTLISVPKTEIPVQETLEALKGKLQSYIEGYEENPFCSETLGKVQAMVAAIQNLLAGNDTDAMTATASAARELALLVSEEVEGYHALQALMEKVLQETETAWAQIGDMQGRLYDFYYELQEGMENRSYTLAQLEEAEKRHEELVRQGLVYELLNSEDAAGTDITILLTNPLFDINAAGWQGTTPTTKYGVAEFYNKTFDMWQDITGLPAGIYEIKMQGFHRWTTPDETYRSRQNEEERTAMQAFLYGNSSQTKIKSIMEGLTAEAVSGDDKETEGGFVPNTMSGFAKAVEVDAECYDNTLMCIVGEDGTLRIGVRCTTNPSSAAWTIFDDVRLTFVGGDLEAYVALARQSVAELVDDYNERVSQETMCHWPAETGDNVAKLAAEVEQVASTAEVGDLMNRIAEAKLHLAVVEELVAAYKDAYLYYEQADVELEIPGGRKFDASYHINKWENGWATEDELADDIVKIHTDWVEYVCADCDLATQENPCEVTAVMRNPLLNWMNEDTSLYWSVTNKYHDPQEGVIDFWNKNAWDIHQDVAYLPQGQYEFRASGCYRSHSDLADVVADRVAGRDDVDVYLYAKNGEKVSETPIMNILDGGDLTQPIEDVSPLKTAVWNGQTIYAPYHEGTMRVYFDAGYWNGNCVKFEVKEGDVVTLGVQKKGASNNNGNMCIVGDFQLFYLSDKVDTISAATASAVAGQAYYTIGGMRLDRPAKGINIVVITLADGTVVKHKVLYSCPLNTDNPLPTL